MTPAGTDLQQQLSLLQQMQHFANSGTAEDCENLKDLFNSSFPSIQQPCSQIYSIQSLLPKKKGDPYSPDRITTLAKQGIEAISKALGPDFKRP